VALPCANRASAAWCPSTWPRPPAWPEPPEPRYRSKEARMLELRIGILVAGLILMAAIWYFGTRPRTGQGRRLDEGQRGAPGEGRVEPTLGAQIEQELADAPPPGDGEAVQSELDLGDAPAGSPAHNSELGKRASDEFDRIVTLYVAAKAGRVRRGPDIGVAAEKAGLTCGYMYSFRRLVDGQPERGPP